MEPDDDEFITANNDGFGLEDDDILLARWEEMLPPGILIFYIDFCVCLSYWCCELMPYASSCSPY